MKIGIKLFFSILLIGLASCAKEKPNPTSEPNLPSGLAGNSFNFIYTAAQTGSPYSNNQEVVFSFSGNGAMSLDENPSAADGNELTVATFSQKNGEYIWEGSNGYKYALSLLSNGSINEINVFSLSGNTFLGQFVPVSEGGNTTPEDTLIAKYEGTYTVTSLVPGYSPHHRMTVIIDQYGNIDFDNDIQLNVADLYAKYLGGSSGSNHFFTVEYSINNESPSIDLFYGETEPGELNKIIYKPQGDMSGNVVAVNVEKQ